MNRPWALVKKKSKAFRVQTAHHSVSIDRDVGATAGVNDIDIARRVDGLQDLFALLPFAVTVAVNKNKPATAPLLVGICQSAARSGFRIFLNAHTSSALDRF